MFPQATFSLLIDYELTFSCPIFNDVSSVENEKAVMPK